MHCDRLSSICIPPPTAGRWWREGALRHACINTQHKPIQALRWDGSCVMVDATAKGKATCMLLAVPASPALPHETLFFPCALFNESPACTCVYLITISLLAAILQSCQPTATTKTTATPQPIPSFLLALPTIAQSPNDARKAAGSGFRKTRNRQQHKTPKKNWQRPTSPFVPGRQWPNPISWEFT